jgi:Protein of unknown function (DUF2934)
MMALPFTEENAMRARLQKLPRTVQIEPQPIPQRAPSDDELRRMIELAAYYRAEKRGFAPGLETQDWCEAEAEVLARMRALESRI